MTKRALVLSGGGMFGAWQAGAWSILAPHFCPDLIVGASVGSLNGYAIAAGYTHQEIRALWRRPEAAGFRKLPGTIRELVRERQLRVEYAVVLVDALRMKEETFMGADVTWEHLVASCAVPVVTVPKRIGRKLYVDGGLLHVLPTPTAIQLGATEILALNALPEFPVPALRPVVRGFRKMFAHDSAVSAHVNVTTLIPSTRLGSLGDASFWNAANTERWYALGIADASAALTGGLIPTSQNVSTTNCLEA